MAVSFTRPDPSSPASIAEANFGTTRKGFDPQEVREFLRRVAGQMAHLQEVQQQLETELSRGRSVAPVAPEQIDEATLSRLLGEETARIVHTAHESAGQIRARAEEGAASVLSEATEEAARVREDAEMEAARRRSEAAELSENEINVAKEQGRQMVNEARAYRERVLGELARRRDMARDQIDQLVHHRDQLLNAFIHARDVAGSVIGGLGPIDVPDDFVDLSPTTGPVSIPAEPDFGANGSATGEGFGELGDTSGGTSAEAEPSSNGGAPVVALFPERESGESGETITEEIPAVEPDAATAAQVDSLFA
jgi:DivIVA domain-containing protein